MTGLTDPPATPGGAPEPPADPVGAGAAAGAQTGAPPPPSRGRIVVQRFRENRVALGALAGLVLIVLAAVFAPLIAPQNPYDLSSIDIADARMPPGSVKLSEPREGGLRATILAGSDGPSLSVAGIERSDYAPPGALAIAAAPAEGGAVRLDIRAAEGGPLDPILGATIRDLPNGARLSAGTPPRFGGTWRLAPEDLRGLVLTLPEGTERATLRLDVTGGARERLMTFWLGTDDQGRDMLSAILYGLRISLAVAATSVVIALVIGTAAGIFAAFRGGLAGTLIMRLADLQMSFPTILVALILLAVLGAGVLNVLLALVIVQWALYARVARGVALSELGRDYVDAARGFGFPARRIMAVHILPNCAPSLIVIATLEVAGAISLEATLSFLGLGMPITQPSLGLLVANGFQYLLSGYPWISVLPGVAILATVLAINLVGDELRDALNPRLE